MGGTYICYLDESGAPDHSHDSTHFVLLGFCVPAESWRACDDAISRLKIAHRLRDAEIHTAWMIRRYPEQQRIPDFEKLSAADRRARVTIERKADLAKASLRGNKAVRLLAKQYEHTKAYVHLTHLERVTFLRAVADLASSWRDCSIFADVQTKAASPPQTDGAVIFDYAFQQVVTRYQLYLERLNSQVGILVQDRNDTASKRLTDLMRRYHRAGTTWATIDRIVETPLFVDSQLTSMVQLADLCSYATRRFFEKGETDLFDRIYPRFDRHGSKVVGLRHYTAKDACACRVCVDHGRPAVA